MTMKSYNGVELTDGLLDALAEEYENGAWAGHEGRIHAGRPRLGEEKLVPVTFKIEPSQLAAIDSKASQDGITRSQELRNAVARGMALA